MPSTVVKVASAAIVAGAAVGAGILISGGGPTIYTPSVNATCASDVTSGLNSFFSGLPSGAHVSLPTSACYLVSNSSASLLAITNASALTINGNGTTFEQTTYDPTGDPQNPVLTIGHSAYVNISHIIIDGPSSSGGGNVEGDVGVLMYQNYGLTLDHVTIENMEGDGLDVYPLGNNPGVNYYVTVNHSTIENMGYHAIVPEAVDHFLVENSTITPVPACSSGVCGDIDAEVDFSCQGDLPNCGTLAAPSVGVLNMTFNNDSFPEGLAFNDGMSCMPIGNWAFTNNNLGTGGLVAAFSTTYSLDVSTLVDNPTLDATNGWSTSVCAAQSGLTITGNTSSATSLEPVTGSGSARIAIQGWQNVTITGNTFVLDPVQGCGGAAVADLWGDSNVTITGNAFHDWFTVDATTNAPSPWPADTGVTVNTNDLSFVGGAHC